MNVSERTWRGVLLIGVVLLGGSLLALMPLTEPLVWSGLRLDALAGALLLLALIGATSEFVRLELPLVGLLATIGAALLTLLALDVRLACIGLLLLALTQWRRWQVGLGLVVQALALVWLGWSAHTWHWNDPTIGAAFGSQHVALLLLGALIGSGIVPLRRSVRPMPILPALVLIYLLLRMYELGPINWGWTLAGAVAGGGAMLWYGVQGLSNPLVAQQAWWGAALAPALLATESGLVATWVLLLAAILASRRTLWTAGAIPPTLPFVALWLGAGAALAGGVPLLAALYWLLAIGVTVGALAVRAAQSRWNVALAGLSVVLGVATPMLLRHIVAPMLTQLGAGLTPFGRPVLLPWIGLTTRNAGSQTVVSLPIVVLAGLMLLACAIGWLLMRILNARAEPSASVADQLQPATLWRLVRRNLPTARRSSPDVESPHDL